MPDKRLLGNWLASYMELTSDLESPDNCHLWTGLTAISAATRRKVWLDMQYGTIYPNLYVIIVAVSAKSRKSAAMDFGRDLLMDAIPDIRIMRDSMTSQGLVKQMNHKVTIIKGDKIEEEPRSDVAIFADEVANLFSYERTRAAQMVIFLTRTYTCPSVYDHTTVRDSLVRLHNLYPVLLGGTDPRNLKVLPEDAVGGLTGRLIWVVVNERRSNNPGWKTDVRADLQRQLLREYLIHDLRVIGSLWGQFETEELARKTYDEWYAALAAKDANDLTTDAFYQRCHVTALRIAELLSLSESNDLIITARHIRKAISLIELQLPEIKRVALWTGNSDFEQKRAKLLHLLQSSPHGMTTQRRALRYMSMGHEDFEKLKTTLIQDGSIMIGPKVGHDLTILLSREGFNESNGQPE